MLCRGPTSCVVFALALFCGSVLASGQVTAPLPTVNLTVVDEDGLPVPDAQVTLSEPGHTPVQLQTDYAGRCLYPLHSNLPYLLRVQKPGFYQALEDHTDASRQTIEVKLAHEQVVRQEVNVVSSTAGIDTEQTSDKSAFNTPEIVNIPYPTSRDIRNLLPFTPGVVQDSTGQIHVAGSETYATLDLLDGFDIRSPVSGELAMRVSADAVRSIDTETTRYPVEFGKATGGVVAFHTGMGDNKLRFNATNFVPSFRQTNGLRFDKFVPRVTLSGPIVRNRAWFFDGLETEYDNIYIQQLPANADTNHLLRGSNLVKAQANLTPADTFSAGLLFNDYHSPYDGLSPLVPQQSTTKRDTIAWLPYIRNQYGFANGGLLQAGFGVVRFRDGYEPHGDSPYEITPELSQGSYFEDLTAHSQREQGTATLYLPPRHWEGSHDLEAGVDLDHIDFDEKLARSPVSYLREDGSLLRRSTFPAQAPFTRHNFETGAYFQDRWLAHPGLLIEPGLRFDWDEIIRRPLLSPRLAATYSPPGAEGTTKLSAGIGLYYEHTQLEYLERALAGIRYDTYYAARWCHTRERSPGDDLYRPGWLPEANAGHQLECRRRAEASRLNLCRGEFSAEAKLGWLRVCQSTRAGRALWNLSSHQHAEGSLYLRRVGDEPHLCQWIPAVCGLYALLGAYQCGSRLCAHGLGTRPAAERTASLGCAQSCGFLGMAALAAAQVQEELGLRLYP